MPPQQRAIDGWPDHWYDDQGYIPCPAQGCTKKFRSGDDLRYRGHHWRDQNPGSPSYNDHWILHAIHRQKDCVYCAYHNDRNLKELLAHEQTYHGTSNMSTIQGYLHLMRQGLDTHEAREVSGEAYQRLVKNVWDSPWRNRLLYRVYPHVLPHEARRRHLEDILSYENDRLDRPRARVVLARDFLTHLAPKTDDRSAWPETYRALRRAYAEGRI